MSPLQTFDEACAPFFLAGGAGWKSTTLPCFNVDALRMLWLEVGLPAVMWAGANGGPPTAAWRRVVIVARD